ncbi:MAG: hypothetical protein A2Y17_11520 [Clostridiales bacterium GWF2_38_85]|nr:MAG: hypothetical protein A2Y17_11520 [Clostridiales bacterium GWF2_38_85]HBL85101.1 hypothetical protein [Clostridiales bacterium]
MPRPKKEVPNRSDGRYEVKITIKLPDGTKMRKPFFSYTSKSDAKQKAENYKIKLGISEQSGIPVIENNIYFSEVAKLYLEAKEPNVKRYTYITTYKVKIDNYITPFFGSLLNNFIRPLDIIAFFNKHASLSVSMKKKFKLILNGIFELAISNDMCYKNPVKGFKIPDNSVSTKQTYCKTDADKLYNYCVENNIVDIAILIKSGIRRSELLGLKWDDINLVDKYINIKRAVTPGDRQTVEDKPKSKTSMRTISVDDRLIELLKNNISTGYVIKDRGTYQTPSKYAKIFQQRMTQICKELGIKVLTPHELRHTHGTLLHERGRHLCNSKSYEALNSRHNRKNIC